MVKLFKSESARPLRWLLAGPKAFCVKITCPLTVLLIGTFELNRFRPDFVRANDQADALMLQQLSRKVRRTRLLFYSIMAIGMGVWVWVAAQAPHAFDFSWRQVAVNAVLVQAGFQLTYRVTTLKSFRRVAAYRLWAKALWASIPQMPASVLCSPSFFELVGTGWLAIQAVDVEEFRAIGKDSQQTVTQVVEATKLLALAPAA